MKNMAEPVATRGREWSAALALVALAAALLLLPGCGILITNGILVLVMNSGEEIVTEEPEPNRVSIFRCEPASGQTAGGTEVVVFGMNFVTGCTVSFGSSAATGVTFLSQGAVRCVTPAGAAEGAVEVTVTNPGGGSAARADVFSYSNWYYDGWSHRIPFTVTGSTSGALTGFQVELALSYDTNMKADFSDLRFAVESGTTETRADFWLETHTASTSAVFWVEVPSIPASPATVAVYAYFGNPSAASASDFSSTFTKTVNTSSLSGWWHLDEGVGVSATDSSSNSKPLVLSGFQPPHGYSTMDGGQWSSRPDVGFDAGSALWFDGIDDFAAASIVASEPSTALTIEAWVKSGVKTGKAQVVASRWETRNNYTNAASWEVFDAKAAPTSALGGYVGAIFDGRYMYFAPYSGAAGRHGEVLRFDTRSLMSDPAAWTKFNPSANAVGTNAKGFVGGCFDGRYVYFSPHNNGAAYNAEVLRYDTQAQFDAAASWSTFSPQAPMGLPWTTKSGMNEVRDYIRSVTIGGKIYTAGGFTTPAPSPTSSFEEFDPAAVNPNPFWTTKAPMPGVNCVYGAAAAGGKLYVMGGYNGSTSINVNWEYDPATNTWTVKTPMPTDRYGLAVESVGGLLYACGGWRSSTGTTNVVEIYDPATNTWSSGPSLPAAKEFVSSATVGGKIYIIGGNGGTGSNTCYMLDPSTGVWTIKSPMISGYSYPGCCALGTKIYVYYTTTTQEYDTILDAWTYKTAMPTSRSRPSAAVIGGLAYVIGGTSGGYSNLNQSYDPTLDTPFANPAGFYGSVFDGRYVYLVPHNNGIYWGCVMRYDTQAPFGEYSSWSEFRIDANRVGSRGKGYVGAVFDGKYVYYIPHYDGSYHGEFVRYDTSSPFTEKASWASFNPGYGADGTDGLEALTGLLPRGFFGGCFDGRYLFFAPHADVSGHYSGAVLRFDTKAAFSSVSSWRIYDPGAAGLESGGPPVVGLEGFRGCTFDGRYVHFIPAVRNGGDSGAFLRYDTTRAFQTLDSWSYFDPSVAFSDFDLDRFHGGAFDGRYVYAVPHDGNGWQGKILRYDTIGTNAAFRLSAGGESMGGGYSSNLAGPSGTVSGSASTVTVAHAGPLSDGWHHMVLTWDGTNTNLYVDGALSSTASGPATMNAVTAPFTVGRDHFGGSFFEGSIDEVRYWGRALSAEEVLAHYERRKHSAPQPTVSAQGATEARQ